MAFSIAAGRAARWMASCLLLAGAAHGQAASRLIDRVLDGPADVPASVPAVAPASERKTKAAYLYRFAAFVGWPDSAFARADSPLVIGIAGDDVLAALVERDVAGHSVRGHPLAVRRLGADADPRAPHLPVHILYVAGPDAAPLLAAARQRPILTVCDLPSGPLAGPDGCVVSFVPVGQHLRFHVARDGAAAARLRISARLLAVTP
jgi:hypothetical protein